MIETGNSEVADRRARKHQGRSYPSIRRGVSTFASTTVSTIVVLAFLTGLALLSGALVGVAWRGFVLAARL